MTNISQINGDRVMCDEVREIVKKNRSSFAYRVGQCLMCGADIIASKRHAKTCSSKCRKALSRKEDLVNTKKKKGLIRINGVAYEAETGSMFLEIN